MITCAADCGACTSWLIHDSITLERQGVASVTIQSRDPVAACVVDDTGFRKTWPSTVNSAKTDAFKECLKWRT